MGKLALGLLLAFALASASAEPDLDARAAALSASLRCLVCQNQTIAESDAPLAVDLRRQVRDKLEQGMGDEQVREFMVARYGNFILYRPPLLPLTWALWFGPGVFLLGGAALLWRKIRRHEALAPLSPDIQQRAEALLASEDQP